MNPLAESEDRVADQIDSDDRFAALLCALVTAAEERLERRARGERDAVDERAMGAIR
jgi:hypothetical protein